MDRGIWSPFRSLLLAQVLAAALGLVFWILVARLVDAHEIGVAAAAISAQTLLGIVTVLGFGTMLISELPLHAPAAAADDRAAGPCWWCRSPPLVARCAVVAVQPLLPVNLGTRSATRSARPPSCVGTAAASPGRWCSTTRAWP